MLITALGSRGKGNRSPVAIESNNATKVQQPTPTLVLTLCTRAPLETIPRGRSDARYMICVGALCRYFVDAGVIACRRVPKEDMRRIAKATGGKIITSLGDMEVRLPFCFRRLNVVLCSSQA